MFTNIILILDDNIKSIADDAIDYFLQETPYIYSECIQEKYIINRYLMLVDTDINIAYTEGFLHLNKISKDYFIYQTIQINNLHNKLEIIKNILDKTYPMNLEIIPQLLIFTSKNFINKNYDIINNYLNNYEKDLFLCNV